MDYNILFQKLKTKYFPELKGKSIILKKRKQNYFMIASPLNKYVFYNEKIMKKCNPKAREAALIHELYHKLQFSRMNPIKRLIVWIGYKLFQSVRVKIERETHTETVKRGFGEGTILLNDYVKSRVSKEVWEKDSSKRHLSKKEIRAIMKKI